MANVPSRHNRHRQVLDALESQNTDVPERSRKKKYAKMAKSAYGFYRGTNHLFWQDMYHDWRFALHGGTPDTACWLQGDAHVYNFGAFGDRSGLVHYGMDDFDDSVVGDYQYDLWRLAVSVILDSRENGFHEKKQRKAVAHLAGAYLDEIGRQTEDDGDTLWTATEETTTGRLRKFLRKTARKNSRPEMLDKWTREDKRRGRVLDTSGKKLERLDPATRAKLRAAIDRYRETLEGRKSDAPETHFRIKDLARRLGAGTGSLGTGRFYALIEGESGAGGDDIILDIKQQTPPEAWTVMTEPEREEYRQAYGSEGQRHAAAFRAIADHPDAYLGWLEIDGTSYSVRQRSPFKEDFPTDKLDKGKHYRKMARWWGRLLACEHVRGSRSLHPEDPTRFARAVHELTSRDRADFIQVVRTLAFAYADCVEQDWRWFREWLEQPGRDREG